MAFGKQPFAGALRMIIVSSIHCFHRCAKCTDPDMEIQRSKDEP